MILNSIRWSIPPKAPLKSGYVCVDVVLREFCVLVHNYVGGKAIVDLSMCAESGCFVAEDALSLRYVGAYVGEDGCPEFQYAIHE